jgi:hypothetical protein
MSLPDFASMDRDTLKAFRKNALKHNEKSTVENNYFTTKPKEERCPQPTDWVPSCIATKWCEYHGPSQHTVDSCSIADPKNDAPKKKAKNQKAKINPKAFAAWQRQVSTYLLLSLV